MSENSQGPEPGRPFGRDYHAGPAGADVAPTVRRRVQRQVDDLAQRSSDAGLRRRLNSALADRWSLRRDTRLAVLTNDRGTESMVVAGELLLTTTSWAVPNVQAYVARRGLAQADLGCVDLESRLVRVVTTGPTTTQHLEDTVAELRERGAEASLTHITPLAPVVKPQSGVSVPMG